MITAVESADPPHILVLGAATVAMFRAALDTRRDELDAWESVSGDTDVDQ